MSYSRIGTQHVANQRAEIGFTNPKTILDRMRQLDPRARAHDSDVRLYAASSPSNAPYKAAWTAWYAEWRKYYDETMAKHDSYIDSAALLTGTDAWAARQTQYEQDFVNLLSRYQQLKDANGNALPSNAPPLVLPPIPPDPNQKSDGIPFWTLIAILGGIAVCVGGYFYIKKGLQVMKAKRDAMEGMLPMLLAPEFGEAGANALTKVAIARDALPARLPFAQGRVPAPSPSSCGDCGRDLDIRPVPRAPAKYMLSGF